MSKYNKLPGLPSDINEDEYRQASHLQNPISKLCCLPILMEGNKSYKNQLNAFMTLEELLPKTQRNQIYQMLYMDKLLDELRSYQPPESNDDAPKDVMDVIMKTDASKNKLFRTMSDAMRMKQTGDMSALMETLAPNNPMMSMLLPMLSMQGGRSGNMMESLLPMMMSGNMGGSGNMMKSLLPMMMGGNMGGSGNMMESLLPMMMGGNMDILSSLF